MVRIIFNAAQLTAAIVLGSSLLAAQASPKPMTNDGVIEMVQAGLSESVIVSAIQSSPANYDVSPAALIKLKKVGGTPGEMQAMIAAQQKANGKMPAAPASEKTATPEASGPRWEMPSVSLSESPAERLPLEKTQLAETKTKPKSLSSLAGDSAVSQGMQAGINDAAWDAASHTRSAAGESAMMQAGSIFGGMMGHKQPMVTYVWGVAGPASTNVLQTTTPKFEAHFAKAPGVNPDEFAPAIVKLTPAQNTCRLVGATQGKEDARSDEAADWEIYSAFVEDRVPANVERLSAGAYNVSPQSPLLPGEYAVVLRPLSKSKKFAGGDVARAEGPGLIFNAVWTFQVSMSAQ